MFACQSKRTVQASQSRKSNSKGKSRESEGKGKLTGKQSEAKRKERESKGKVKEKQRGSKEGRKAIKMQLVKNLSYNNLFFYVASFALGSVVNIKHKLNVCLPQ